jgi:hypothetical protein
VKKFSPWENYVSFDKLKGLPKKPDYETCSALVNDDNPYQNLKDMN